MQESDTAIQENNPAKVPLPESRQDDGGSWLDFFRFALLAIIIVVPIRAYVAQPFIVSGDSMIPNYHDGNYLIIDEISYRFEKPKRGEVIVFRLPRDPSTFLIKRIAGLPNETIQIEDDTVTIINSEHPDGFLWNQGDIIATGRQIELTMTLGEDEYFVLGDNRNESADSRLWGRLPGKYITGRPIFRLFPLTDIAVFPERWSDSANN